MTIYCYIWILAAWQLILVAKKLIERDKQLLDIAYNTLRKKVAKALLMLEKKYNTGKDKDFVINMGRDELAAIAGTATESLVRTLTDFKSEKLIEMQNGPIEIVNLKKLENMLN